MTPLSPFIRYLLLASLLAALGLLLAGIGLPMISIEKFFVFENEVSLWSGTWGLLSEGEYFLGLILLTFSIAFPVAKNLLLMALLLRLPWAQKHADRLWHVLAVFGRWSMLDVFIVAVLVCSVKLGMLAHAELLSGIYFFTASVLLTNGISTGLDYHAGRRPNS